jgi:hypothetical protein
VESYPEENFTLESRFREEEVKAVVFGSYANEALGLGRISLFFLSATMEY